MSTYFPAVARGALFLTTAVTASLVFSVFSAEESTAQQQAVPQTSTPDLPPVEVPQAQPPVANPAASTPKPAVVAQPNNSPATVVPVAQTGPTPEPEPADPATALGTFNPALDTGDLQLPPGTTITTAGPVDGYRALTAMSSTRTATPIEQIPQSIQVVPRSVLEDQNSLTVDEALRNVSGVQATNSLQTPAFELARIRGFAAEQWLDGLTVYYNAGNRDALANVERIEVLKGPAAILYGGGAGAPVGGAINVISKLPTDVAGGEFGFTFGSFGFLQPTFDINQPLTSNGTVLFRITGEYTSAESFIDVLETERYAINPTLTLTDKTDTTLTIQGRFNRWEQQEYQGLPATGTVFGAPFIDRELFIGPADVPDSYSEVQGVTVTLDHRFNDFVSANVKSRWSRSEFAELAQSIGGAPLGFFGPNFQANAPLVPPSTWALTNIFLAQTVEEFTINPTVTAKFEAGPTKNTLLFGGDYSRLTDDGILTFDYLLDPTRTVDLANPSFPFPYIQPPDSPFTTLQRPENIYETQGLYTQIQSSFYDTVHLLAGVRLANVQIDYVDPAGLIDLETDKTKVLPRIGAVVDIVQGGSVYASYSEGLKANPFTFFAGPPEPEESQQSEVGFKFNTGTGLTGTLALFEIERSKVPVGVPGGFGSLPIGEQRSRGFEADVLWQPNSNWQVLANYAFVEAELVNTVFGAPPGTPLVGVPEHSGRFWVNYAFDPDMLKGWSVGAGIYAASGAPVELGQPYETDSFFTIDAKIGYESEHYVAAINVKNLTGEEYFVPYNYFNGRVAPGEDRAVYGTLKYRY